MEAMFLATMLSCADGAWVLGGLVNASLPQSEKSELRLEIIKAMPDTCSPGQYKPSGRK